MNDRALPVGVAKLSIRLALGRRKQQVWRRASLIFAGSVCALALMSGGAVSGMIDVTQQREFARTAVTGLPGESSLMMASRADIWRAEQFPVVLVEPAGSVDDAPLPPGLSRLPDPGKVAVSPRLAELAAQNGRLLSRYSSSSMLIESEGLLGPDELLAYARPTGEQTLADAKSTRYVVTFGAEPNTAGTASVGLRSELPTTQMVLGGIALLGVPALLLLCASTATASTVRDRRLSVLRRLGISRGQSLAIVVVDAVLWTGAGATACVVASHFLFPRLTKVPLLGLPVFEGDLKIAVEWTAGVIGIVVAAAALSAVATDTWRRRTPATAPVAAPDRLSRIRVAPMLVGLSLVGVALITPGRLSGTIGLAGAIMVVLGLPLLMPYGLATAGGLLRQGSRTSMLLAGRRLQRFPTTIARPLFGLAGLTLIVCCVLGFLAVANAEDPSRAAVGPETYRVSFLGSQQKSVDDFRHALPGALVLEFAQEGESLIITARCKDLSSKVVLECASPGYGPLVHADARRLGAVLGVPPDTGLILVESVPDFTGRLLVVAPAEVVADDIRNAAARTLLAPVVSGAAEMRQRQSPLVSWLLSALLAAAVLGALTASIMAIDGTLRSAQRDAALRSLGLTRYRLARLEAVQFAASYITVIGSSFLVGVGLCYVMATIGASSDLPWSGLATTGLIAAGGGVVIFGLIVGFGRLVEYRPAD